MILACQWLYSNTRAGQRQPSSSEKLPQGGWHVDHRSPVVRAHAVLHFRAGEGIRIDLEEMVVRAAAWLARYLDLAAVEP